MTAIARGIFVIRAPSHTRCKSGEGIEGAAVRAARQAARSTGASRRNHSGRFCIFTQMVHRATQLLTDAGTWLARPIAFLFVLAYLAIWLIFDRQSFHWHEILTLATLFMTLFIQRSEHRDMQAVQAKLDELLRVHGEARELNSLDDEEPEQVEAFREVQAGK